MEFNRSAQIVIPLLRVLAVACSAAALVPDARGAEPVVPLVKPSRRPKRLGTDRPLDAPPPPRVLIVTAEQEYDAKDTLPAFGKAELGKKLGFKVTCINSDSTTDVPGLEALDNTDLLVLFMRRRTLPESELKRFQAYFEAGKPVVALRTSCHAFQNWLEFDELVLGCHYHNHYDNGLPAAPAGKVAAKTSDGKSALTHVTIDEKGADDAILRGVTRPFDSASSLYKVSPLTAAAHPLLLGRWDGKPAEPVAWTNRHKGGRVFFTSLGHPRDFEQPEFRRLLRNAVLWALDRSIPTS